jgi:hypothetical protein
MLGVDEDELQPRPRPRSVPRNSDSSVVRKRAAQTGIRGQVARAELRMGGQIGISVASGDGTVRQRVRPRRSSPVLPSQRRFKAKVSTSFMHCC